MSSLFKSSPPPQIQLPPPLIMPSAPPPTPAMPDPMSNAAKESAIGEMAKTASSGQAGTNLTGGKKRGGGGTAGGTVLGGGSDSYGGAKLGGA